MKQALSLLLALCLLLGLAACSGGDQPTQKPAGAEDSQQTTAAATTGKEPVDVHGTIENDAYINECLNLKILCPDGWFFYTEEQIAQANNLSAELFKDTNLSEIVESAGQAMDMMLSDGAQSSMNLIIQQEMPAIKAYTDEQVFKLSEMSIKSQISSAGWEIRDFNPKTMTVGGEDRMVLYMALTANGVKFEEYQIWFRTGGDYMGVLTLALMDGRDPQPYLDGIFTLHK